MAEPMQVAVKIDIGAGSGSSASIGDRIVLNREQKLHTPNALAATTVGKSYDIPK